jgi:hypothetical protein
MSDKIKVDKIVLDIHGKKIELSLDEAMELKKVLNDTFGHDGTWWYYSPHIYTTPPYTIPPTITWSSSVCITDGEQVAVYTLQ